MDSIFLRNQPRLRFLHKRLRKRLLLHPCLPSKRGLAQFNRWPKLLTSREPQCLRSAMPRKLTLLVWILVPIDGSRTSPNKGQPQNERRQQEKLKRH